MFRTTRKLKLNLMRKMSGGGHSHGHGNEPPAGGFDGFVRRYFPENHQVIIIILGCDVVKKMILIVCDFQLKSLDDSCACGHVLAF